MTNGHKDYVDFCDVCELHELQTWNEYLDRWVCEGCNV